MEDNANEDHREFILAVVENIEQKLKKRLVDESSKRPRVLTETHLLVTLEAVNEAVIAKPPYSSWPTNEPPTIEVSADKETQWLREAIENNDSMGNIKLSPCIGRPLDLQIRQGSRVLVNMESELGGNRQRAEDMAKLTNHETQPVISIMMTRVKSYKNLETSCRNLAAASADRKEPFINVVEHWPDNQPLNTAASIVKVVHSGGASIAAETYEDEQDEMDDKDWEDDESDEHDFTDELDG